MIGRQFITFLGVGLTCALIDISIMELLRHAGVHDGIAVSIGFATGVVLNYILHARLTFRSSTSKINAAKFAGIVLLNYGITIIFVYLSTYFIGSILIGKIASLPVIAINGFLLSRYWAFK